MSKKKYMVNTKLERVLSLQLVLGWGGVGLRVKLVLGVRDLAASRGRPRLP